MSSRTVTTTGRGIRKVVSLFENLSSIVDEADRRVIENDDFEGVEGRVEDAIVTRAYDSSFSYIFYFLIPNL
jgi:hypothetical protein